MKSSLDPAGTAPEAATPAGIFSQLQGLDLAQPAVAIQFVQKAYADIIQQGYQQGERSQLRGRILQEETNGWVLTRDHVVRLQWAVELFELHEKSLPSRQHEAIGFLVGVYGIVAGAILDMREDTCKLNEAFYANVSLCKLYSAEQSYLYELFSLSLSRHISNVYLSTQSTLEEKKELLVTLASQMSVLKSLLDRIMLREKTSEEKSAQSSGEQKNEARLYLQDRALICATEASQGPPEPEKWFYMLWQAVEACAQKFAEPGRTGYAWGLFAGKPATLFYNLILQDKVFIAFAAQCANNVIPESKEEPVIIPASLSSPQPK